MQQLQQQMLKQQLKNRASVQTFGRYRIGKTLGKGYQAKVKICFSPSDEVFAVKIFKRTHTAEKNLKTLLKEAGHLTQLKHDNLVNLVEILTNEEYIKKDGTSYVTVGIVLEYCPNGELFDYLLHSGRFSEPQCRHYFRQLLSALQFLHLNNVCHRDLKPENILLNDKFKLKLADFGFSAKLDGKDGEGYLMSSLGTESYMAPELNEKKKYIGSAVDIFAAGIILFIMYTGHPPFLKASENDPYYKLIISDRNATFWEAHSRNKDKGFFTQDFMNLINAMLANSPEQRINLAELVSHQWVRYGKTLDSVSIQVDFQERFNIVQQRITEVSAKKAEEKKANQARKDLSVTDEEDKEEQQEEEEEDHTSAVTAADEKKQATILYTGNQKFRSGQENLQQQQFKEISKQFQLDSPRMIQSYDINNFKSSDLFINYSPQRTMQLLLLNHEEFCSTIELSATRFKAKCTASDPVAKSLLTFSFAVLHNGSLPQECVLTFEKVNCDTLKLNSIVLSIQKTLENAEITKVDNKN